MHSSHPDDLDSAVLDRYLAGRSSPGDDHAVARWLAADPARQAVLQELQSRLRGAPLFDVEAMLSRTNARIDVVDGRRNRPLPFGKFLWASPRRQWLSAAAAVVAIVGLGIALLRERTTSKPTTATSTGRVVLASDRGERKTVRLSDGSMVVLAPQSRLVFDAAYGHEQREVTLQGQAAFTVRHDPKRPFRVHTPMGVAEDLGTEFDVRAYPEDTAERVVVASGTVLFRAARGAATAAVLQRNQMGRLAKNGVVEVRRGIDAHALLGWMRGELVFDDVPLVQVAADLHRWYGADVRLGNDRVRNERFTATFRQANLEHVLEVMTQALDLHVIRLPTGPGNTVPIIVLRSGRRT